MKNIVISDYLMLQQVTSNDYEKLYLLMQDIYPKSYHHFWSDNGNWYIDTLYNPTNIENELAEANTGFFFVNLDGESVGILRIQYHKTYSKFSDVKATKLHRIYLHPKTHRKGVGKALIEWTKTRAKIVGDKILWLEAMDTQPQALSFYKKMGFQIGSHVTLTYERIFPSKRGMYQMWITV